MPAPAPVLAVPAAPARPLAPITEQLDREADRLASARVVAAALVDARQKEKIMASVLEIKGLGTALTSAKAGLRDVRQRIGTITNEATLFAAELADVEAQLTAARADLAFEAQTLGNSAGSQTSSEKPKATGA